LIFIPAGLESKDVNHQEQFLSGEACCNLHQELRRDAEPVFFAILRQWIEGIAETTLPNQLQGSPGHPVEDFNLDKRKVKTVRSCVD
jgi:hypothetical protein